LSDVKRSAKVLIVGAGVMGSGIAQVAATSGDGVWLYDHDSTAFSRALERISSSLRRSVEKGHLSGESMHRTLNLIKPCDSLRDAGDCDIVVEAVKEDRDIKKAAFKELQGIVPRSAMIFSNTSMISISDLASALEDKSRFCGMHFFNPVPRMALVEVIAGKETSPATVEFACSLATRWGKKPVLAPDSPGFIVNRIFDAIKREALSLHEEGVDVSQIDQAVRLGLNFPMGPFELMDLIGLDTTYDCLVNQARQMNRNSEFGTRLPDLVSSGRHGRKSGRGFYTY